ncbi:MAG: molybdenum cofactor guanylyltransferase [Acidobacteria bacterium]|nr:molybdenum cofactor guanylyltransferase [Acidobacteriota bacterium]
MTGGASSRMGRDKSLLPFRGRTLVEHVAGVVAEAAGSATLIGAPERYYALGLPVIADTLEPSGPLGGIVTALRVSEADWNLVVACDMPALSVPMLASLLAAAREAGADCLLPVEADGRAQPLCAVYHRRAAAALEEALRGGVRKVTGALAGLRVAEWRALNAGVFENVNTPSDWEARHKR